MTKIYFPKDVAKAVKASDATVVIASAATFGSAKFPTILSAKVTSTIRRLAKTASPGDRGAVAKTLSDGKPAKLIVGVLPNRGSRYNSPMRAEAIRSVAARAGLRDHARVTILLILDHVDHALAACNAVGRSLPLLSYKTKSRSQSKSTKTTARIDLLAVTKAGKLIALDKTVRETVDCGRIAARLVDTAPTELDPAGYAKEIKSILRGIDHVKVQEIRGDALLKAKLGGIHAVGRCALSAPRVLVATYTPKGSNRGKPIALVGKGVTYDTGGLHLKGRGGMETMKSDMGGSAAVLGAFRVLATTKAKLGRPLQLVMCLAENAIGPSAYKPDDILTMHSGKTVEINNTDAEGRLLLADGVSYAARVLKATTILDAATLTGAQLIATGLLHAAVFSNHEKLEHLAVQAGRRSGDLCHPLPFAPEFYKREFASPIADMRNSVKNRGNAQSSCAAQFIYWHIEDTDAQWCHVDLAGPAFPHDRGTGYGVALIAEMVRAIAG